MSSPTVAKRIAAFPVTPMAPLPAPDYSPRRDVAEQARVMLGLECFARHMTDEGHQLQIGLQRAGYEMWGPHFDNDFADVPEIMLATDPAVVIMQDKREWDSTNGCCLDPTAGFKRSEALQTDASVFKLTICKDAHSDAEYHRLASAEIGCHAWISYYHPDIVHHFAPYTRPEHIIRTWHSIDAVNHVPNFKPADERRRCVISGATSNLYPLRQRITANATELNIVSLRHPGYHARGSHSARFLEQLNGFKVAICTASKFGYSLRKIIEATAVGCVVITDLPPDDLLPAIDDSPQQDGNLVRISPSAGLLEIHEVIEHCVANYDEERQKWLAEQAMAFYDWRVRGPALAAEIEQMRKGYGK